MQLGLNKVPWYGQLAIFGTISAAAVGLFYYFYATGVAAQIAQRQKTLDGLRAEVAKAAETARRLPEFEAEVTDLEARLNDLKAVLPEQKDVAGLLTKIQTLATQSNLVIRGFKPGAVTNKTLHAEWPITLEIDGTYHNLGSFFDKVSKVPRIININGIEISALPKPEDNHSIQAKCLATTFVLLENPQPEAAKGAKGAKTTVGAKPQAAQAAKPATR
ncbi:MAG: type 4a pilus biogenesis protein PilO [Vicinamibacterales bacterium]